MNYEIYKHHNRVVTVRSDLKGKHRDFCLCYQCGYFFPEKVEVNCKTAQILFSINRYFNVVTPVWECPDFMKKPKKKPKPKRSFDYIHNKLN